MLSRDAAVELLIGVRRRRALLSLYEFFKQAFATIEPAAMYEDGPHISAICDHVQWQLEERARAVADPSYQPACPDLLINQPPRTMKTLIIQVAAVAWAWLHWPELKVMSLSNNPRVSALASDQCRNLIRSEWYQTTFRPDWTIRSDKDGTTLFANTAGGHRAARGIEGSITGEGADWRIIDDPHDARDSLEAMVKLCAAWDSTIANRKNNPRTTITTGVMQRLSVGDWSAHVRRQGWVCLVLPMEFEREHPLATPTPMPVDEHNRYKQGGAATWKDWRTEPGEILHPRFTSVFLALERKRLGTLGYAGQMQQRPAPGEGGTFKKAWFRFFKLLGQAPNSCPRPEGCNALPAIEVDPKSFDWITVTIDATFGKSVGADNVGLLVIAGRKADRFILHDATAKMDIIETMAAIKLMRNLFPKARKALIEKKANGDAILTILGPEFPGLIPIEPEGGKDSRANACSPMCESGNVYLLDGADWLATFIDEVCTFPNGDHDDRVDAMTQLLIYYGISNHAARFAGMAQM